MTDRPVTSASANPRPYVATTRQELTDALDSGRRHDRVVLVPTMGALHAGHAELLRTARALTDGPVVASVFVNPLQFAAGEDLDRYPRTLEADLDLCAAYGVDVVFAPGVTQIYPDGDPRVTVDPGPLGSVLEGAARPTHLRGVLTVVAKLFGLVRPDVAVFGEKDYQQLVLVRRMAADLALGVDVVGVETVRETDGLARSSRNRFLSPEDRVRATVLSRALRAAQAHGVDGGESALAAALAVAAEEPAVELDYLTVTGVDLGDPPPYGEARVLVAARLGRTRLIDNLPLTLGAEPGAGREGDARLAG